MNYQVAQIEKIVNGKFLINENPAGIIEHLLLDSRKLLFPASSIFFALNGPRRNGNSFIKEVYNKGVRNFVVDESFEVTEIKAYTGSNFLQVKDVLAALHLLVAHHRAQFNIPVIGITGSNGKTIVKEWLYQLLQEDYTIVRSPKSYNSQIGVPLSVWQMNEAHTLAIFEAGISQPGEMQQLEKIIQPGIGVFTSIGDAHSEGFLNIRQKVNEKLKLFVHSGLLIYGADNPDVNAGVNTFANNVRGVDDFKLFSWSSKGAASLQIISIEKKHDQAIITAIDHRAANNNQSISITIPFTDDASVQNAITCWSVLLHLQTDAAVIRKRMLQLRTVEMRLELKQGINNCSVINDSYSADINSLTIALDFLVQQQQHPNRTVILSDILQSGKSSVDLYNEVAAILEQKKVNRFIGIGPEIFKCRDAFKTIPQIIFFSSIAEFMQQFFSLHFYNETVLLKGARIFEFEQISHLLEEKVHQTVLEINLNSVTHNLKEYQQLLKPGVKLMAMVKAFSYGSGGFEIANLLQFHKVDYLAVAFADEGVELRRAGISLPILVLNPEETTFDLMVQYNLEPELYSFSILSSFRQYLQQSGVSNYPVHIKLDTGMHRLGFEAKELAELSKLLLSTVFKVQSVFSHLAASDEPEHDAFTKSQADEFLESCGSLQKTLGYSFIRHIANTSSIHRHPGLQLDMVRLGIGLYGIDHEDGMQAKLKNVSTLKTTISQIKQVAAGESVGYGRKGFVTHDAVIATVRIGYADGYARILSNGAGKMWVNGNLVPVIGNICMDMTMLDITGTGIREGDEVIVFGEPLPVSDLAIWAKTIPYEILTGISQRVKRVYYEE
ncbi:MAG: bifunctional UDP-N-acetylmuramoyl-tripeptide:D-alanyl-D-alanine ligase/alanine racemase [Ferruginibacter sp.]|nr:bifunctional UDP-N-acetylmuramoyl-tripeptide:D-alanyl-D-alanine ligase/alanine racemase [Ferruginibacter sp.]